MDEARRLALEGQISPVWIVADEQSGGRGRHGRNWASPPGNLYATLSLPEPCAPAVAPELGFVAGLALHAAASSLTGLGSPRLALKWPNDLLLDGAKTAGLLLEGLHVGRRFTVLIGFGVNVASAPQGLPYPAKHLAEASPAVTRDALFGALSAAWADEAARWENGFSGTRNRWLELAFGLGSRVTVRPPGNEITGRMTGIDERGRLLLTTEGGPRVVDAGDLFFGETPPR
jgi:BirA family biotin operon repressor/biotin-[acetyl-CoA-carboxylase] ligase